jgi:hypothetical protein
MNIADLVERDHFPVMVVDLARVDWSQSDFRPGGLICCEPNAIRFGVPRAVPWEQARRLLEEP